MSNSKDWRVTVVGATGLVGTALVAELGQRNFPLRHLTLVSSDRGLGREVEFRGRHRATVRLDDYDFSDCDLCFFAAGASVALENVAKATEAGAVAIDLSSAFRRDDSVPLVVAEVNAPALALARAGRVVALPSSTAVMLARLLKPLYAAAGLERVQVLSLESASAGGQEVVTRLATQSTRLLNGQPIADNGEPQLAFNCVPLSVGDAPEGPGVAGHGDPGPELQRLLEEPSLRCNVSRVRVPAYFGESAVVHVETRRRLEAAAARELLAGASGVTLADPGGAPPTAVADAIDQEGIQVGWVGADRSHDRGLSIWVVSDNIRASAATNAVQIAEILVRDYL